MTVIRCLNTECKHLALEEQGLCDTCIAEAVENQSRPPLTPIIPFPQPEEIEEEVEEAA